MSALAKVSPTEERAAVVTSQYLTFTLASELFAVPIETIREVIEFHGITRIPLAPAAVPGVLNLRGQVIPIVDLSVRFGRAPTAVGRRTCVIVVEMMFEEGMQPIGVIVDSVSEALEATPGQLEQRPTFGTGIRSDFVDSMLDVAGNFVIVLDLRTVLSMSELESLVSEAPALRDRGRDGARLGSLGA